jgi:hypothetical protein
MIPEILARALLAILVFAARAYLYPAAKLAGYRWFEPDRQTVLVTCCTNGLGHVHQMERVLGVLQDAGFSFPVVALAKEQKVPAYKLTSLKERFPDTTFVNLNFEIDYDNGKSFNNLQIAWSATKQVRSKHARATADATSYMNRPASLPAQVFTRTPFRKITRLIRKHRPAYCLSFWEPSVATYINAMNCPTKVVSVASQGQVRPQGGVVCGRGVWVSPWRLSVALAIAATRVGVGNARLGKTVVWLRRSKMSMRVRVHLV